MENNYFLGWTFGQLKPTDTFSPHKYVNNGLGDKLNYLMYIYDPKGTLMGIVNGESLKESIHMAKVYIIEKRVSLLWESIVVKVKSFLK